MERRQQRGGGGRGGGATGFRPSAPSSGPGAKSLVDLAKYMNKEIQVKFAGGKEGNFS